MTSRVFYYFSITCFVFGLFTFPFTNNVFSSFSPCMFFGVIAAVASLLESDVDRTRRDAVIALCISVVAAIALSILAPQFGIIWWGPVILLMETIAIVSLIRRYKRKLDSTTQLTTDLDAHGTAQNMPNQLDALPDSTTTYAENSWSEPVHQPAYFQTVHAEQQPLTPQTLQARQPDVAPESNPHYAVPPRTVSESNQSAWLTGLGVLFVLICGGVGGYLFLTNHWWVNVFDTEVSPADGHLGPFDPVVCCTAIIDLIAGIFCSIAGSAGNYLMTALAGIIVGMAIGLAIYGVFLAIYFAIKSSEPDSYET